MILAPGLTNEDIDGNGHADELYLEFEVWTFLVFFHASYDLHSVFLMRNDLHDDMNDREQKKEEDRKK